MIFLKFKKIINYNIKIKIMKEVKKNWLDMFITENYQARDKRVEGSVIKIADGVVTIRGLEEATAGEMLKINIVSSIDSKNSKKSLEVDFVYQWH